MRDYCGICCESYDDENLATCQICKTSYCYRCGSLGICKRCAERAEAAEAAKAADPTGATGNPPPAR